MDTEKPYRYLYEYRIEISDNHWGHKIDSSVMDIFDENYIIIKARPAHCPKLLVFYKAENPPIPESVIFEFMPQQIAKHVDRRTNSYCPTFCVYVLSHEKNKIVTYGIDISGMVKHALHELRKSENRPQQIANS